MAGLGKRRPPRTSSGVSGLQGPRRGQATQRPPVEEDRVRHVERLAHDGRGVAHAADGKAVFIEGALPGERIEVAVHRTRKRFDEAHVQAVCDASPERVAPPCAHYDRCGGCDLQHLALDAQRRHKVSVLVDLLARQGVVPPVPPDLLVGEGEGYRRRARLGVKVDAGGDVHLGFRARRSQRLVDIDRCSVLVPSLDALLAPLHRLVATLEAPRQVGHLELVESDQGAVLVVRQLRDHPADRARWQGFAERHSVNLARRLGRESPALEWITPPPTLTCSVPGPAGELSLAFNPGDFLQANGEVNRRMIATALDWLGDVRGERLLDLFAGIGNFSLPLAAAGANVTALEGSPAMVERLAANARRNGLDLDASQADLNRPGVIKTLLANHAPDTVVLDPPRGGAEFACRALAQQAVMQVLYVSCDPATLARDVAQLIRAGYRLERLAVADMFAHTSHLESLLLFTGPQAERQPQGASSDG